MSNKTIFGSAGGKVVPPATALNEAGGRAYEFSPKHALAQFAVTGTFRDTFYITAEEQLRTTLELCSKVESTFIAKLAIFSREKGYMKDMPALLCAVLTARRENGLLEATFKRVVDNSKMLRNFLQIMQSGVTGRKFSGNAPKRIAKGWFDSRTDDQIFRQSVGTDGVSLADALRLVHPKPKTESRRALYGYISGRAKELKEEHLPELVKQYEAFKKDRISGSNLITELPKVPMEMLTGLPLSSKDWEKLAENMSWTQTRMNINTMSRHGVFKHQKMVRLIADRLQNRELIQTSKVFPYQLLAAYMNTSPDRESYSSRYSRDKANEEMPWEIGDALQEAMEIAVENVPTISGKVLIFPDVSGSMSSPVTGHMKGSTSKVRCIDIAALVAAVFMRKNPGSVVVPFENDVVSLKLNPRDSIMTNADKLSKIGGGGTNCSAPIQWAEHRKLNADLIVYVSDNESWVDSRPDYGWSYGYRGTRVMEHWSKFKLRNPKAKMVCIDIQANGTTQAKEDSSILNIGGFSDKVFEVINQFVQGGLGVDHWVGEIESITL